MKFIFIIFFTIFSFSIFANEGDNKDVEVINLYDNKSLDQLVLENLNEQQEIGESVESSDETIEIATNKVEETQLEIVKDNFIYKNNIIDHKSY